MLEKRKAVVNRTLVGIVGGLDIAKNLWEDRGRALREIPDAWLKRGKERALTGWECTEKRKWN